MSFCYTGAPYEPRRAGESGVARFARVDRAGVDGDGSRLIETEEIEVTPD